MRFRVSQNHRRGSAAVEFAVVLTLVLMPTLIGVWEVGRLVQVQQIVASSAREGARLAAQAVTITPEGQRTEIMTSTGTPNVRRTVYQYLVLNGLGNLEESDVQVGFKFTSGLQATNPAANPYQGIKGDRFEVTVTIPFSKVKWVNLGLVNPQYVTFTVAWTMLVDDPFVINPNLPAW
jgi:Flp pilus assembly protein TadG